MCGDGGLCAWNIWNLQMTGKLEDYMETRIIENI